jgi:hypothetical protein
MKPPTNITTASILRQKQSQKILRQEASHDPGKPIPTEILDAINGWGNSIFRPTIPRHLIANSTVTDITPEGAKLLTAILLYGERTGERKHRPYDDGEIENRIQNLKEESLWLYGPSDAPSGFEEVTRKPFAIPTGKTCTCPECRGEKRIICRRCKGKGRYIKEGEKHYVDCNCDNGTRRCSKCDGFGKLEEIIECRSSYRLKNSRTQDYKGMIPKCKLARAGGKELFSHGLEYRHDNMTKHLLISA